MRDDSDSESDGDGDGCVIYDFLVMLGASFPSTPRCAVIRDSRLPGQPTEGEADEDGGGGGGEDGKRVCHFLSGGEHTGRPVGLRIVKEHATTKAGRVRVVPEDNETEPGGSDGGASGSDRGSAGRQGAC